MFRFFFSFFSFFEMCPGYDPCSSLACFLLFSIGVSERGAYPDTTVVVLFVSAALWIAGLLSSDALLDELDELVPCLFVGGGGWGMGGGRIAKIKSNFVVPFRLERRCCPSGPGVIATELRASVPTVLLCVWRWSKPRL